MKRRRHRGIQVSPTTLAAALAVLSSPAASIGPADGPWQEAAAAPSSQQQAAIREPLPEETTAGRAVAEPSTGGKIRVLEPLPVNEQLKRTVLDDRLFDATEPMDAEVPEAGPPQAGTPQAGTPQAGPQDVDGAFDMVQSWAQAWSDQDVDLYLSFYSRELETPGASRQEWERHRRQRISQPALIKIEISSLQGAVGTRLERFRISFRQAYSSDTFSDVVRKTFELVREDGGWKILREESEDWR